MFKRILLFFVLLCIFSCKETVFNAGLENRVTAVIDFSPELYNQKIDFTSDEQVENCSNSDVFYVDEIADGSIDNKIFKLTLDARDFFKSENNCNQYDWYTTTNEEVDHELQIIAFVEEIQENMYVAGSQYLYLDNYPTNAMLATYKLKKNADEYDNNGLGIDYYGFNVEMDIQDLDFASGTVSGTFSATLYRATEVSDPSNYMGVDGVDADLFNPAIADFIDNYELVDSIRIENGVFQRITLINNTSIN